MLEPTEGTPGDPSDDLVTPEERLDRIVAKLHEQLDGQPTDADWSHRAAEQFAAQLRAQALGHSRLLDVDCRTTTCRVEVAHTQEGGAEHFCEELVSSIPWNGEVFFRTSDDAGESRTVVYVSREGHTLM